VNASDLEAIYDAIDEVTEWIDFGDFLELPESLQKVIKALNYAHITGKVNERRATRPVDRT
jgi:hypothetical protein